MGLSLKGRYSVQYSPQARRFLNSLEKHSALRFLRKMEEVAADPFGFLEHYEGQGHKLRVGKFRALVDVDQARALLFVRVLDKRSRIYK